MGIFDPHFTDEKAKAQRGDATDRQPRASLRERQGQSENQGPLSRAQKASMSSAASELTAAERGPREPPVTPVRQKEQSAARWDYKGGRRRLPSASVERRHMMKCLKSRDLGGVGRPSHAAKFTLLCKSIHWNMCQLSPWTDSHIRGSQGGWEVRDAYEAWSRYPDRLPTSQTMPWKRTPYIPQFPNSGLREPLSLTHLHMCYVLSGRKGIEGRHP